MMRTLILCLSMTLANLVISQDILFEAFTGGGSYTASTTEYVNGSSFFTNTDNNVIPDPTYTVGLTGDYFVAKTITSGAESITWSGLNIQNITNLDLNINVSEDDSSDGREDWDSSDFVHFDYRVDGGTYMPLLWIEADGFFNAVPYVDTDFDGVGDGTEITDALVALNASVSGLSGTTLDLRVTFSLNGNDEDLAVGQIRLIDATPLPVNFTAFTATPVGSNVQLDWTTASEINNSHFVVEMSENATDFYQKAYVNGEGTTESVSQYSFVVNDLSADTYYFRLRQVDFDGQFTHSNVLSVHIEDTNNTDIVLFGNRVANNLTFEIQKAGRIRILSQTGTLVKQLNLAAGRHDIDLSNLASGMYLITNGTDTKRFIK